jgi:hypothetical protein
MNRERGGIPRGRCVREAESVKNPRILKDSVPYYVQTDSDSCGQYFAAGRPPPKKNYKRNFELWISDEDGELLLRKATIKTINYYWPRPSLQLEG